MVIRNNDLPVNVSESVQGGDGSVVITKLCSARNLYNEVRMFSKLTIKTGCGIGSHSHTGECEAIYMLKGEATYFDNGETVKLYPGDSTFCPEGEVHWIRNDGEEDVEIIALIVVKV